MGKKYEIIGQEQRVLTFDGRDIEVTFNRIKALVDIHLRVKAGEIGGLIYGEDSLSQEDDSWVDYDSLVYNSEISGDVLITNSEIYNCNIAAEYANINHSVLFNTDVQCPWDYVDIEGCTLRRQIIMTQVSIHYCSFSTPRAFTHLASYFYMSDKDFENEMFIDLPSFTIHRAGECISVNCEYTVSINHLKSIAGRKEFLDDISVELGLTNQEIKRFDKIFQLLVEDNEYGR